MSIRIDDGSVREPILNAHGQEIGVAIYNPHDVGVLQRYKEKEREFDGLREVDPKSENLLAEVENVLKPILDYIFYPGFYAAAFSHVYPLTKVGEDDVFCLALVREIISRINATITKDFKSSEEKKKKYLEDYE